MWEIRIQYDKKQICKVNKKGGIEDNLEIEKGKRIGREEGGKKERKKRRDRKYSEIRKRGE